MYLGIAQSFCESKTPEIASTFMNMFKNRKSDKFRENFKQKKLLQNFSYHGTF